MEYNKTSEGKFVPLSQQNVDTGMGVERTLVILNKLDDVYMTDCLKPIIGVIEHLSGKGYKSNKEIPPAKNASVIRIALPTKIGLLKISQRSTPTAAKSMKISTPTYKILQVVLQKYEQNVAFRDNQ